MRGAGGCGGVATGGAAGRCAGGGGCCAVGAAATGDAGGGAGCAITLAGGAGRGVTTGSAGGGGGGATTIFSASGGATTGRTGITGSAGAAGGTGGVGFGVGCTIVGRAAIGGAVGFGGVATASFCCVIAFSTSPGREMCERSILVLISSSPRNGRDGLAACADASDEPRIWARTFSASCSSRELECVFFSVTPTSVSTSRMALLLTSSSLARSLIRTLLIRPFLPRVVP